MEQIGIICIGQQFKHRREQHCKLDLEKYTKTEGKCFKQQLLIQYQLWIRYITVYRSVVDVAHNNLQICILLLSSSQFC